MSSAGASWRRWDAAAAADVKTPPQAEEASPDEVLSPLALPALDLNDDATPVDAKATRRSFTGHWTSGHKLSIFFREAVVTLPVATLAFPLAPSGSSDGLVRNQKKKREG